MTILHIATSLEGGAGIGLWRYHQALLSEGVDSRILILNPSSLSGPKISKVNWRKHPLPLRIAKRAGLWLPKPDRLKKQIASLDHAAGVTYELFTVPFSDYCPEEHPWIKDASIVNIHWVAGMLDWPRFFQRITKPVVITLHDQQAYLGGFHYVEDVAANPRLAELEATFQLAKQQSLKGHRVGVIANSQWNATQARLSGFFTVETAIEVFFYPLDTALFSPRPKAVAKRAVGIDGNRQVIGFACENLNNRRKGFDQLIDALNLLPESMRAGLTLLSFGRAPTPALRERVTYPWIHLGFLKTDEEKIAAYAAMDVFVAPSRAEAFGLTALEAEAVGVPVVATRVGGLAEAVPVSVPPDATSIRDDIVRLLTDVSQYKIRAEAGRRLAVERHSPALIGKQMTAFYKTLIG